MKLGTFLSCLWIVISASGCASPSVDDPPPATVAQKVDEARPAPLFDNLGSHHHQITTSSPLAQRYFDQGLIFAYAFNHSEAGRSFEAASKLDPSCAMAFWGMALVLGPHVNAPMNDADVPKAYEAVQRAMQLAKDGNTTDAERAYIAALGKRYAPQTTKDRSSLDLAYAEAMRQVVSQFPDDVDAMTLCAEALMDTMPWDYWLEQHQPKPATKEVLAMLEKAIARDLNHPGANHLYIHAVEAGPTPQKGLASADRLRSISPGAGHLVHMPAHIYLRLGRYQEASRANEIAIEVDQNYLAACKAQGYYPLAYYPHNVHFLWYSTAMEGRSAECLAAARKAAAYTRAKHCGTAEANLQRPLPLLALARFGRWDELLAEPQPTMEHTFDLAVWHYARGVALARKGRVDEARKVQSEFALIAASEEAKKLDTPSHPATSVIKIAGHELSAEIARAEGRTDEWISELTKAVESQDALPYMEPPYWYYPVRHALGAALLELSRADEAEKVYRDDLKRNPQNGWSLKGLAKSLSMQGKQDLASEVERQFQHAWQRADVKIEGSRI
jgi:tetratricopeptide (TPR) repeat protein